MPQKHPKTAEKFFLPVIHGVSDQLVSISSRLEPVASLFPAEFRSFISAKNSHIFFTSLRNGSQANFSLPLLFGEAT